MIETYEIRTMRGTPVYTFDDEHRARKAMLEKEKKVGVKMQLYRIIRTEEKVV